MMPWKLLDSAQVPESGEELRLYQRGGEFSIRVDGRELMNSRAHGSEEALAELACVRIAHRPCPRVLIGGLGMGYTTAAALHRLGADGQVVVAELVPAVVAWNRGPLADLAGRPLEDARVTVREVDVARILQAEQAGVRRHLAGRGQWPRGSDPERQRLAICPGRTGRSLCGTEGCGCVGRMVGQSGSSLRQTPAPGRFRGDRGLCAGAGSPGGRPTHNLARRPQVNPVRNSSGALNPAGIILKFNPAAAAGPEGAAGHYF